MKLTGEAAVEFDEFAVGFFRKISIFCLWFEHKHEGAGFISLWPFFRSYTVSYPSFEFVSDHRVCHFSRYCNAKIVFGIWRRNKLQRQPRRQTLTLSGLCGDSKIRRFFKWIGLICHQKKLSVFFCLLHDDEQAVYDRF